MVETAPPKLVEKGYVYIAMPPLYKIKAGKKVLYSYNDVEKDSIIEELQSALSKNKNYRDLLGLEEPAESSPPSPDIDTAKEQPSSNKTEAPPATAAPVGAADHPAGIRGHPWLRRPDRYPGSRRGVPCCRMPKRGLGRSAG